MNIYRYIIYHITSINIIPMPRWVSPTPESRIAQVGHPELGFRGIECGNQRRSGTEGSDALSEAARRPEDGTWMGSIRNKYFIELDDGKILTGKPYI
jgi:hypothetical protein